MSELLFRLVALLLLICMLVYMFEAKAGTYDEYMAESVEYISAYSKLYPEDTKYECFGNRLSMPKRGYIRDYEGKHVKCTVKIMTRGDYEVATINNLF